MSITATEYQDEYRPNNAFSIVVLLSCDAIMADTPRSKLATNHARSTQNLASTPSTAMANRGRVKDCIPISRTNYAYTEPVPTSNKIQIIPLITPPILVLSQTLCEMAF